MENIIKSIQGSFLLYSGKYDFDVEIFPFQVNNNFFYLTGIEIPNFVILYDHKKNLFLYFFEYKDNIWFDNEIFLKDFSSKKVENIDKINKYIENIDLIYSLNNIDYLNLSSKVQIESKKIDFLCNEMRVIKNSEEIKNIENACLISSNAIHDIMEKCKKFNNEQQIISTFKKFILEKYNIEKMAYLPICSNGEKNSILHYVFNKRSLQHYNLILLDIGCKYNNYCSDITRTFPKSGKFTKNQKKIYTIVLKCQEHAINLLRENITWEKLQISTRLLMYELLLKINIVFKTENQKNKIEVTNIFMPHGLGHTIGLDVHDTNFNGKQNIQILKENMVVTIEPGVYFIKDLLKSNILINQKEVNKYIKIGGIRIEDTILIKKNGYKILSNCPKDIDEIENTISNNF